MRMQEFSTRLQSDADPAFRALRKVKNLRRAERIRDSLPSSWPQWHFEDSADKENGR